MAKDPLLGRVVDGKYRIDGQIGAGGMATIYRAMRLHIGDVVAVKVLHSELLREPHFAERFRREAQAAARLRHPNVVAIYDFGLSADGLIYLVMELVEGRSLRTIIAEDGPMAATRAAEVVRQVAAALTQAHNQKIVHRDIKPANIAVESTPDGPRVKVLDFGIVSLRGSAVPSLTQTGAVLGTPAYMSPEQCLGEELDGRSDIYSLGIVLFEMLCGVVPFNSPTAAAVIIQHVQQAPPPLRVLNASVSAAVEAVVLRALAKRPQDRFQTARELADALTAAVSPRAARQLDRTIVLNAPGSPPTVPAHRVRTIGLLVGSAAIAVLATIGVQRAFFESTPARHVAPRGAGRALAVAVRPVPLVPAAAAREAASYAGLPDPHLQGPPGLLDEGAVTAYQNGKYDDVVDRLTTWLQTPNLHPTQVSFAYRMRGQAYTLMADYHSGLRDTTRAIETYPNPTALNYYSRAKTELFAGQYPDAIADFTKSIRLGATWSSPVIWRHVARSRNGENDSNELLRASKAVDYTAWPAPIVRLYLGETTENDVLTAASTMKSRMPRLQRCEAFFHLGEHALILQQAMPAGRLLKRALQVCPPGFERNLAVAELARLPGAVAQ